MPEGDTVWLAAQRLRTALVGQPLTVCEFRVPQLATADFTGQRVLDVVPRGKHLLTRLEGGLSIHTHFRMDGSFRLFRTGTRWTGGPGWQIRLVLGNASWVAVGYRLPVVEVVETAREDEVVGHLGPDVLGPDWDLDTAVSNLRENPDREIGTALLDQRNLAGIGNLYRTEALFLAGINPWTPVTQVRDLPSLVSLARRLMLANRGRAVQTTTGRLSRHGGHHVFERQGQPCRRCGATIRLAAQGDPGKERKTYWCPRCQPAAANGPAQTSGPAASIRSANPIG